MGNIQAQPETGLGLGQGLGQTSSNPSGLNYSGRVYTNQFQKISGEICPAVSIAPNQISDVFPNGVSSITLPQDESTHRISQTALQTYVDGLIRTGAIPGERSDGDLNKQMLDDQAFYTSIRSEYCFYESRYKVALDQFLTLVSSGDTDQASVSRALKVTIDLNARLNSLLEILNSISTVKSQAVNTRGPVLNSANTELQKKLSILQEQHKFLGSSDVRSRTQEEMIRFSAEKNRAMNIQIMFFVALNIVALGTIITVYRSSSRS
jgi:hypothetical protein